MLIDGCDKKTASGLIQRNFYISASSYHQIKSTSASHLLILGRRLQVHKYTISAWLGVQPGPPFSELLEDEILAAVGLHPPSAPPALVVECWYLCNTYRAMAHD